MSELGLLTPTWALNRGMLNRSPNLLSRRQVGSRCSISISSVIRLEKKGALTPIVLGSRTIRYTEEDVENLRCRGIDGITGKGGN
jgi:predicted DNA-binding transcriptional regulator AlpA